MAKFSIFWISAAFSLCAALQIFGYSRDFLTYQAAFSYYVNINQFVSIEPSFILMASLLGSYQFGFNVFIFIMTMTSLGLKGLVIKRCYNNYLPVFIFYLGSIYFLHEYTQVRFAVGLGLFYYGFINLDDRGAVKWQFFVLSVLLHYSMIILVVLYLLSRIQMSASRIITSLLFAVLIAGAINVENLATLFNHPRLAGYTHNSGTFSNLLTPGKLILYVPYILHVWQKSNLHNKDLALLHLIIVCCIATINLPEVISNRIAGMGYFLAIILLFKVRFEGSMPFKNLGFMLSTFFSTLIFTLVLL